jgi:hypothetical protein
MAVQSSVHIQRTYDIRGTHDRGSKQQTQNNPCVVHHDSRKFSQMRVFSKAGVRKSHPPQTETHLQKPFHSVAKALQQQITCSTNGYFGQH